MTDHIDPQDAQEPINAPDAPDNTPEPVQDASDALDDGKGNKEAARYRRQLRETQAERDTLRTQLAAMQRAEVVRLAGERLANGDDLLTFRGDDLAPYLTEEGDVDADAVQAAAEELRAERGYLAPRWGDADSGPRKPVSTPTTWADALKA